MKLNPGQIFLHFKGGIYSVVAVSKSSDSQAELVTYKKPSDDLPWTRLLREWFEAVSLSSTQRVCRFTQIYDETGRRVVSLRLSDEEFTAGMDKFQEAAREVEEARIKLEECEKRRNLALLELLGK